MPNLLDISSRSMEAVAEVGGNLLFNHPTSHEQQFLRGHYSIMDSNEDENENTAFAPQKTFKSPGDVPTKVQSILGDGNCGFRSLKLFAQQSPIICRNTRARHGAGSLSRTWQIRREDMTLT